MYKRKGFKANEEKRAAHKIPILGPSTNNMTIRTRSIFEAASNKKPRTSQDLDKGTLKKKKEEIAMLEDLSRNTRIHTVLLAKKTRFSVEQIDALIKIYKRLTSLGRMDRLRFRETLYSIFDITDDIILDRIFGVFDGDNQGSVSETEWVLGMSTFLRGSLDEQIAYCYEVYDIDGDHRIGREEVNQFLQGCITPLHGKGLHGIEPDEVEECTRDIAEIVMKKLDDDGNGLIDYSDFHAGVSADPTLLEALGPCLPPTNRIKVFLAIFTEDYWNHSTNFSHPLDLSWDLERNKFARKKELMIRSQSIKASGNRHPLTYRERRTITSMTGILDAENQQPTPVIHPHHLHHVKKN